MYKGPRYERDTPKPEVPFPEEERLRIVRDFPDVIGTGPFDEYNSPFGYVYRAGYQKIFLKRPNDIAIITFHDKDLKFHAWGSAKRQTFDTLYAAVKWFVETPKEERRYG